MLLPALLLGGLGECPQMTDDCDEPEVLTGQRLCVLANYRPVSAPRASQVYLLRTEREPKSSADPAATLLALPCWIRLPSSGSSFVLVPTF